jgi:integrase
VPLVSRAAEIVTRWAAGKARTDWIFSSTIGTALGEGNWRRSVKWNAARMAIGRPTVRVHDLRHTAASIWLAAGADPKVVQRILGHASAAMTMDLYGHLIDQNLWDAAKRVSDNSSTGGPTGALDAIETEDDDAEEN